MPNKPMAVCRQWLLRNYKQLCMLAVDFVLLSAALLFAMWARLGHVWLPDSRLQLGVIAACIVLTLIAFMRLGLYRSIIRYIGQQALFAVMQGVMVSAALIMIASFLTEDFMPRSVPIIYACFSLMLIGGSRFLVRAYYFNEVQIQRERVAIYGAGTSGLQVSRALQHGKDHRPICFFDDSSAKHGVIIDGLKVYPASKISRVMQRHGITKVLLAMPSVSLSRRREIMQQLSTQGISVQMVPGIEELLEGSLRSGGDVSHVYDDILGRNPVEPNLQLLNQCIAEKVVLVTGAAGSIGSELCRQIVKSNPQVLLLFDSNEFGLYTIQQELQLLAPETECIALLGSVIDQVRIKRLMKSYRVQTVYHAAAYKHVPLVEHNMLEGVRNNIFGTHALVQAAIAANVDTFVLVSTDKAVRPTSIMGVSKRCAELICQAYAASQVKTKLCMVRFGNVLGSSGSVVPLFFEQINKGGPVTVTHPEVTRYFMTIPEAAQLVLQAGSMSQGGDVFVLNMGKPVQIRDLAARMITLLGYTVKTEENPRGDIEIVYTGLRPGEKLYEELVLGERLTGTDHPMIMRAEEAFFPLALLKERLQILAAAIEDGNCAQALQMLKVLVGEFTEHATIVDHIWQCEAQRRDSYPRKVTHLPLRPKKSS